MGERLDHPTARRDEVCGIGAPQHEDRFLRPEDQAQRVRKVAVVAEGADAGEWSDSTLEILMEPIRK